MKKSKIIAVILVLMMFFPVARITGKTTRERNRQCLTLIQKSNLLNINELMDKPDSKKKYITIFPMKQD